MEKNKLCSIISILIIIFVSTGITSAASLNSTSYKLTTSEYQAQSLSNSINSIIISVNPFINVSSPSYQIYIYYPYIITNITTNATSPNLTNITILTTETTVNISWTTNESSNSSIVIYTPVENRQSTTTKTLSHSFFFTGLLASTPYTGRIASCTSSTTCTEKNISFRTSDRQSAASSGVSSIPNLVQAVLLQDIPSLIQPILFPQPTNISTNKTFDEAIKESIKNLPKEIQQFSIINPMVTLFIITIIFYAIIHKKYTGHLIPGGIRNKIQTKKSRKKN